MATRFPRIFGESDPPLLHGLYYACGIEPIQFTSTVSQPSGFKPACGGSQVSSPGTLETTHCLSSSRPSSYGALVKCEEGNSKVSGLNPCGQRGEIKMPSIGGSLWGALSLMHAAVRQA
eukprot:1155736-Pelagomonas_calceolata.AAC.2